MNPKTENAAAPLDKATAQGRHGAAHGSGASELWAEYLRNDGHEAYKQGCCCGHCQAVRERFSKWKSKHAMKPETKILPDTSKAGNAASTSLLGGQLLSLWMNFCIAEDGAQIELANADEDEANNMIAAGLIQRKGKWAWLTDKGNRARDKVSA